MDIESERRTAQMFSAGKRGRGKAAKYEETVNIYKRERQEEGDDRKENKKSMCISRVKMKRRGSETKRKLTHIYKREKGEGNEARRTR